MSTYGDHRIMTGKKNDRIFQQKYFVPLTKFEEKKTTNEYAI